MSAVALQTKTTVRAWARRFGLIRSLSWIRSIVRPTTPERYENAFATALLAAVRTGDCVWDVGANVGLYSRMLRDRVGPDGLVCAFEPAPKCYEALLADEGPNLQAYNLALGDKEAVMALAMADNPLGTTHSLVYRAGGTDQQINVRVTRGDDVLKEGNLRLPNVIKVDVEGFEEEVIEGLDSTLARTECRALFCEVHFAILEQRGRRHAPSRIEKTLRGYGFSTRWVDPSHLAAVRG